MRKGERDAARDPWQLRIFAGEEGQYLYEMSYARSDNPRQSGNDALAPLRVRFSSSGLMTPDTVFKDS